MFEPFEISFAQSYGIILHCTIEQGLHFVTLFLLPKVKSWISHRI